MLELWQLSISNRSMFVDDLKTPTVTRHDFDYLVFPIPLQLCPRDFDLDSKDINYDTQQIRG